MTRLLALLALLASPAPAIAAAPPAPPGFAAVTVERGDGFALRRFDRAGTEPVAAFVLAVDPAKRRLSIVAFDRLVPHGEILRGRPALALLNGGFHMARGPAPVALGTARGAAGAAPSVARKFPHLEIDAGGRPAVSDDVSRLGRRGLQVLQSKPRLLYGGKVSPRTADAGTTRAVKQPRAGIAVTGDGRALLVVVEGRTARSSGMTLHEFARFLRDLGGRDALAMDGGGTALLVFRGTAVNTPSGGLHPFTPPGVARPLLDAILVE